MNNNPYDEADCLQESDESLEQEVVASEPSVIIANLRQEINTFQNVYQEALKEKDSLKEKIRSTQKEISRIRAMVSHQNLNQVPVQEEIIKSRAVPLISAKPISTEEGPSSRIENQYNKFNELNNVARNKMKTQDSLLTELHHKNRNLEEKEDNLAKEIEKIRHEQQTLEGTNDRILNELVNLQKNNETLLSQVKQLITKVSAEEKECEQNETGMECKKRIQNLGNQLNTMSRSLTKEKEKSMLLQMDDRLFNLEKQIHLQSAEKSGCATANDKILKENEVLRNERFKLQQKMAKLKDEIFVLSAKVSNCVVSERNIKNPSRSFNKNESSIKNECVFCRELSAIVNMLESERKKLFNENKALKLQMREIQNNYNKYNEIFDEQ